MKLGPQIEVESFSIVHDTLGHEPALTDVMGGDDLHLLVAARTFDGWFGIRFGFLPDLLPVHMSLLLGIIYKSLIETWSSMVKVMTAWAIGTGVKVAILMVW